MKIIFKNTTAICLATLVLFSTMSFAINEHYCGGELVATAIFTKAKTCGMEMQNPIPIEEETVKNNCCKDLVKVVEGADELKLTFSDLELQQQVFIASFVYSYINLFEGTAKETVPFKDYTPPLIVKDIHVLDSVFLI